MLKMALSCRGEQCLPCPPQLTWGLWVTHMRGPRSEENSQWKTTITRLFLEGGIGFLSRKSSTSSSMWRFTAPCEGSQ